MKLLPKRLRKKNKETGANRGVKNVREVAQSLRNVLSQENKGAAEPGAPGRVRMTSKQATDRTLGSKSSSGKKKAGTVVYKAIHLFRKNGRKEKGAIDNTATESHADPKRAINGAGISGLEGGKRAEEVKVKQDPNGQSGNDRSALNSSLSTQAASNRNHKPKQYASSTSMNTNNQFLSQLLAYKMYDTIPELESTKLPRGGLSMETESVGRVQFGIPPETIKDSMSMGIDVPLFYIVPIERFCRELGPALGVNLAEFEFPAYFNFFIQKKRCTLIVDNEDAERNIRRVFGETLLGPAQFRLGNPISFEEEDFAPNFPREAIPDLHKELKNFRVMPDGNELEIETLLRFTLFQAPAESKGHEHLGVPPAFEGVEDPELIDFDGPEMSSFARVKLCERAVLYPPDASEEQIANRTCKRLEIFKVSGGGEYILHDIDEDNIIIGKGTFSGNLRVSASMGVNGWENLDDDSEKRQRVSTKNLLRLSGNGSVPRNMVPPTFHPPSFGVTVLGNSHGFDKSGSTSGYVLWINGRGVMIDPPPYSSATLEREGIRPRTIVGIILTHCHADHDAGAFQKVLTGAPVVVITTPTIYKSFIRKYAALSALSPALLRHSHRHKPAIIGMPLRFQGATFHFTYTLHSIPCVGFRVDWRGRSMVFTGDHFNSPDGINQLQEKGILSSARAEDLRNLPMQMTDLLLHEAGVPPLHTPLEVLMALPQRVKDRLYVVHTQKLPEGCELRVAPIGTAGTIRLDEKEPTVSKRRISALHEGIPYDDDYMIQSMWMSNEYDTFNDMGLSTHQSPLNSSFSGSDISVSTRGSSSALSLAAQRYSLNSSQNNRDPPAVALRPTSSTDAWFILNLLSAVPFLSGLSYQSTMEVLETARVDAYSKGDVVVAAARRREVLCVVWEGTCIEREISDANPIGIENDIQVSVWHAGDWTGPVSIQPEKSLSGESELSSTHDIIAMSSQGVKVITVEYSNLHSILKAGSPQYCRYLDRKELKHLECLRNRKSVHLFKNLVEKIEIMDIIECNTTLRKISAVQKRHLESLAEGPIHFEPGERLWKAGMPVETAFIIVGGTATFSVTRRNGSSVGVRADTSDDEDERRRNSLCEMMRKDAEKVRMLDSAGKKNDLDVSPSRSSLSSEDFNLRDTERQQIDFEESNFQDLSEGLQKRAEIFTASKDLQTIAANIQNERRQSDSSGYSEKSELDDLYAEICPDLSSRHRMSVIGRHANKQLVRLYKSRAFTAGLVFSRGHFLGDVSKMVGNLLSSNYDNATYYDDDDITPIAYGLGDKSTNASSSRFSPVETIHEIEGDDQPLVHSSTLAAGKDGCVVLSFSRQNLVPFFDEHPGLLLSLLGTQVVI